MPVVIALVAIIALIGIANLSSLVSGNKKAAPASALPMRPAAANAQQVIELRDTAADAGTPRCGGAAAPAGVGRRDAAASGGTERPRPGGRRDARR